MIYDLAHSWTTGWGSGRILNLLLLDNGYAFARDQVEFKGLS